MTRELKWYTRTYIYLTQKKAVMDKLRNKKGHKTWKTNSKMAEVLPISNYIKCKWIKLSN